MKDDIKVITKATMFRRKKYPVLLVAKCLREFVDEGQVEINMKALEDRAELRLLQERIKANGKRR